MPGLIVKEVHVAVVWGQWGRATAAFFSGVFLFVFLLNSITSIGKKPIVMRWAGVG